MKGLKRVWIFLVALVCLSGSLILLPTVSTPASSSPQPIQLAVGQYSTCALQAGIASCWGAGDNGRLGNNNAVLPSNTPVNVSQSGLSFTSITAGFAHVCALTAAGQAYCWGSGAYGQLGNNATSDSFIPIAVTQGGVTFTSIAAGGNYTCGLTSTGQAYCWGINGNGNLGNGNTTSQLTPVAVTQGGVTFTSISTGVYSTCGLTAAGQAYCWGYNYYGQLGNGNTTQQLTPVAVTQSGIVYSAIYASTYHTCSLTAAGQAYCWGGNWDGRGGNGGTANQSLPVAVTQSGITYSSLSIGSSFTCGLTTAGQAYCWGYNALGSVGDGTTTTRTTPTAVVQNSVTYSSIVTSSAAVHTCAVANTSAVYCWGQRYGGRLGDNAIPNAELTPKAVSQSGLAFTSVVTGAASECGLTSAGQTYCWGRNGSGQLGVSDQTDRYMPTAVSQSGITYTSITAGNSHVCGLTSAGQAYCWGNNSNGRLGNNSTTSMNTPVAVTQSGVVYTSITAGANQTCALANTGQAYCWGYNGNGALGTNDLTDHYVPTAVSQGAVVFTSISTGFLSTCALANTGQAYCWGGGGNGRLGNGATTQQISPVAVNQGAVVFTSVVEGNTMGCGLTSAGKAYCWGGNGYGQLGNGGGADQTSAVAVSQGALVFSSIQLGYIHTCALTTSNVTYCWGYNVLGQLGNGNTTNQSVPTAVSTNLAFTSISVQATPNSTCALVASGQTYCWGDDHWGELGVWTGGDAVTPVKAYYSIDAELSMASATIDPAMTFTVAAHSGACNGVAQTGSATATSMNLGHINSSSSVTASQDLTTATNAGGGVVVYTRYTGPLSDGNGHTIADMVSDGGWVNAQPFPATGTAAFGYRFDWQTAGQWESFKATNQNNLSPATGLVTSCLIVQAQTAPTTPSGSYSTSIIYTAVPTF